MSNNVSKFEKELKLVLSKEFFFKEPEKNKVVVYAICYLILVICGAVFGMDYIVSIFSVFFLCYIAGARGLNSIIFIGLLSMIFAYISGGYYSLFWVDIHLVISLIIYLLIINRYSKIFLVISTATVIFLGAAIYLFISIKTGYLKYDVYSIQNYLDNYINNLVVINKNVDKDSLNFSFETIKFYLPSLFFIYIFCYSLVLVQITLKLLSKEKVIIPVYPDFKKVNVYSKFTIFYILITMLSYLLAAEDLVSSIYYIILQNFISILKWVFILNGLFTCYFFIDINNKNNSGKILTKLFLFVSVFITGFIFEFIGVLDSLLKLREYYWKNSKGE